MWNNARIEDVKVSSRTIRLSVSDVLGSTITTGATIHPVFGFDLSLQAVGTGDDFDELSKKLFNEGKISRYADSKYFDQYKKRMMYWDGEGWSPWVTENRQYKKGARQ